MTRELNQLLKKLKTLSPDDVARVEQFVMQLKTPERRGLQVALRAVPVDARPVDATPADAKATESKAVEPPVASPAASPVADPPADPAADPVTTPTAVAPALPVSGDAEAAHAASAQWRRRPFQTIDADDLQPIAALFREAVDSRAASRIRFGSR